MLRNKRILINITITLVVIIAVIAGVYFYQQASGPKANVFLSGGAKGKGMSFFAPDTLQPNPDNTNYVKIFSENYPGSKNSKTTITATSATVADATNTAAQLSRSLKSRTGTSFVQFSSTQGTFMQNLSATGPTELDLSASAKNQSTFEPAVSFTNKHIKKNAWRFDYTYKRMTKDGKTTKVDGTMIYAIGSKAYYRLLISSVDDNWQTNQATWKKITDSLNINR